MASFAEQKKQVDASQAFGERYYRRAVGAWYRAVVAAWKPGSNTVTTAQTNRLEAILRRGYDIQARQILGTDYRRFKQDAVDPFTEIMEAVAAEISAAFSGREVEAAKGIAGTTGVFFDLSVATAEEATETAGRARAVIARRSMARRSRNHTLTIAVTEANWVTQITRTTSVIAVNDPLGDSIGRLADLIEAGQINEARRLARSIDRIARLPNSVTQGKVIDTISDVRDRLVTPGAQARIVASLRALEDRLGTPGKEWLTVGDAKVRASHVAANHQRRAIEVPYILAGGRLQYPGDASLGASLAEVVNCRCASLFE